MPLCSRQKIDLRVAAKRDGEEDRDVCCAAHPKAIAYQLVLESRHCEALIEEQQHEFHAPCVLSACRTD
jgi:hypothetical protein